MKWECVDDKARLRVVNIGYHLTGTSGKDVWFWREAILLRCPKCDKYYTDMKGVIDAPELKE